MLAEEWKSFEDLLWILLIFKLVKFLNFQYLRIKRLQHECVIMHLVFPQFYVLFTLISDINYIITYKSLRICFLAVRRFSQVTEND